jgi:glucuronate isomerase
MPGTFSPIGSKTGKTSSFLTEEFLLETEAAKNLYFSYARELPIIDYHNHLPPADIANNKTFLNLTDIWLSGDHYKWRAMRALGIDEYLITGNSSDNDKFLAWAKCVPATLRNPLFHWSQMELKNPFGINDYLNEESAPLIYDKCNALLKEESFSARGLLKHFNVKMVGTTDDPCDDLKYHRSLSEEGLDIKVLPTFRPDKLLNIANRAAFLAYVEELQVASGIVIKSLGTLEEAIMKRLEYFHDNGCRISDHGLCQMPSALTESSAVEHEFEQFLNNAHAPEFSAPDNFAGILLIFLCKAYSAKGWVQQFHLGPIRNNNTRLNSRLGADAGVDSIGDFEHADRLSNFLNMLEASGQLAKTIIYNSNPADNEMFAAMCGNFSDGITKGKVQYGSGWWFLDQKDGMERQLNALSNMGIISTFIGMTTDSRSFLSYSRHEYFRRILCNLFGKEMESGLLPNDEKWIGGIIQQICFTNAKEYFNF